MAILTFVPSGTSASGKTKVWEVRNQALPLGIVASYAHWRRHVLPESGDVRPRMSR